MAGSEHRERLKILSVRPMPPSERGGKRFVLRNTKSAPYCSKGGGRTTVGQRVTKRVRERIVGINRGRQERRESHGATNHVARQDNCPLCHDDLPNSHAAAVECACGTDEDDLIGGMTLQSACRPYSRIYHPHACHVNVVGSITSREGGIKLEIRREEVKALHANGD